MNDLEEFHEAILFSLVLIVKMDDMSNMTMDDGMSMNDMMMMDDMNMNMDMVMTFGDFSDYKLKSEKILFVFLIVCLIDCSLV